jgi:hypothetical protein
MELGGGDWEGFRGHGALGHGRITGSRGVPSAPPVWPRGGRMAKGRGG